MMNDSESAIGFEIRWIFNFDHILDHRRSDRPIPGLRRKKKKKKKKEKKEKKWCVRRDGQYEMELWRVVFAPDQQFGQFWGI